MKATRIPGVSILAVGFLLAAAGLSQAQVNIDVTVTPGPPGVIQTFSIPAVTAGTPTFVSMLPTQSPGIGAPASTTYRLKRLTDAAFVAVPGSGASTIGAPVHSQVSFTAPIAASGLALIRIDHLTNAGAQTWQIQIETAAADPTICFAGISAQTTQALTQVPRLSLEIGATYYNNHCPLPGVLVVPASIPMNFPRSTIGTARTLTATIQNTGTANLPLSLSALAAPFSVGAAGAPLLPNERRDVPIVYSPTAAGTQMATLTAGGGATSQPVSVDLALSGQALFRDIILCVDRSNSMNWDNTGTALAHCTPSTTDVFTFDPTYDVSRIRQVRHALEIFRDNLLSFTATDPLNVVRVGMVHFPAESMACGMTYTDSQTYNPPGRSGRVPMGATNLTVVSSASDLTPNLTTITDHGFYHSTPMIAGLETSRDWVFPVGSTPADRFRAIILFSDGAHNVPEAMDPNTVVTPTLLADQIRLYGVAFGTSASVNPALLQSMAMQTHLANEEDPSYEGFYHYDPATMGNDANLAALYAKVFKDLMELDTAVDPPALIAQGGKNVHEAWVTSQDARVNFTVAWTTNRAGLLKFELTAPNGRHISPNANGVSYFEGPTHKTYAIDLGKHKDRRQKPLVGKWTLEVEYPKPADGAAGPASERYSYTALVSSDLRMRVKTDRMQYYTGDQVLLTARLSDEGRALRGQQVTVQLNRPDLAMGNWFAANKVPLEKIEGAFPSTKPNAEHLSNAFKKQLYLTNISKVKMPGETPAFPGAGTPMYDDGTHGDAVARDGIYSAILDGVTRTPGTHRLIVQATGKAINGDTYRRETEIHHHVLPRLETALLAAQLKVAPIGGDDARFRLKTFRARVEPKDKFGNLLGPGFERDIHINSSSGRALTSDVVDDLEGGYYRDFEVDTAAPAPVVDVTVRGERVPSVILPLEPGSSSGGGSLTGVALVLALLIILVLLAMLSRCCGRKSVSS